MDRRTRNLDYNQQNKNYKFDDVHRLEPASLKYSGQICDVHSNSSLYTNSINSERNSLSGRQTPLILLESDRPSQNDIAMVKEPKMHRIDITRMRNQRITSRPPSGHHNIIRDDNTKHLNNYISPQLVQRVLNSQRNHQRSNTPIIRFEATVHQEPMPPADQKPSPLEIQESVAMGTRLIADRMATDLDSLSMGSFRESGYHSSESVGDHTSDAVDLSRLSSHDVDVGIGTSTPLTQGQQAVPIPSGSPDQQCESYFIKSETLMESYSEQERLGNLTQASSFLNQALESFRHSLSVSGTSVENLVRIRMKYNKAILRQRRLMKKMGPVAGTAVRRLPNVPQDRADEAHKNTLTRWSNKTRELSMERLCGESSRHDNVPRNRDSVQSQESIQSRETIHSRESVQSPDSTRYGLSAAYETDKHRFAHEQRSYETRNQISERNLPSSCLPQTCQSQDHEPRSHDQRSHHDWSHDDDSYMGRISSYQRSVGNSLLDCNVAPFAYSGKVCDKVRKERNLEFLADPSMNSVYFSDLEEITSQIKNLN